MISQFNGIASDAGACLRSGSTTILRQLATETLSASRPEHLWVWSVFDLAWKGVHPTLKAEKRLKEGIEVVPYDSAMIRELADRFG